MSRTFAEKDVLGRNIVDDDALLRAFDRDRAALARFLQRDHGSPVAGSTSWAIGAGSG